MVILYNLAIGTNNITWCTADIMQVQYTIIEEN